MFRWKLCFFISICYMGHRWSWPRHTYRSDHRLIIPYNTTSGSSWFSSVPLSTDYCPYAHIPFLDIPYVPNFFMPIRYECSTPFECIDTRQSTIWLLTTLPTTVIHFSFHKSSQSNVFIVVGFSYCDFVVWLYSNNFFSKLYLCKLLESSTKCSYVALLQCGLMYKLEQKSRESFTIIFLLTLICR